MKKQSQYDENTDYKLKQSFISDSNISGGSKV